MERWIGEKSGFIFDVDGTLYSQPRMRGMMFVKLFSHYAIRPWKWKELYAIWFFRKCREKAQYRSFSMKRLYATVARQAGMCAEDVESVIHRWMFEVPLDVLRCCSFPNVISFIRRMYAEGKKIVIYSDYPAMEKLSVLDVPFHFLFVSGESGLPALKPCAQAMRYIVDKTGLSPQTLLYIGDREEKDGRSARLIPIDYLDVREFQKRI